MRKLLLATTALAGVAMFAAGAQAAEQSPLNVAVGGYVDFRAGQFSQDGNDNLPAGATSQRHHDFETEWKVNVDVTGKAMQGVDYGARVSLWNGSQYNDAGNGGTNNVRSDQAYVYLSGQYGQVTFGDHHGGSDVFVYAPTVGANQVDGIYTDFLDPTTVAVFMPTYIDNTEDNTKVTYVTPQVGNENHKVQLGVTYTPDWAEEGQNVIKYRNTSGVLQNYSAAGHYKNIFEIGGQYQGNFNPVNVVLSFNVVTGDGEDKAPTTISTVTGPMRDFTAYMFGGQVGYAGFTIGGSYADVGNFATVTGQNDDQSVWTAGIKYEWDKLGVAFSYLGGEGYYNSFARQGSTALNTINDVNYVESFNAYGFGATYNWFPGLSTSLDTVFFTQERADRAAVGDAFDDNDGHVVVLSQKLTF